MRTPLALLAVVALLSPAFAQDRYAAHDTTQYTFPETASLRSRIALIDSARAMLAAAAQTGDSLATLADSIRNTERSWEAAPLMRSWVAHFPHATDSMLVAWLDRATLLYDSAAALRTLDIQRSAVRIDSARGVVDLAPIEEQRVYRVRNADSTVRYIQFDNPLMIGDRVATFAAPFGRKIFIAPGVPGGWDMVEGSSPAVGPDSVFDVLREVTRPRAYDLYDQLAGRVAALRALNEQPLSELFDDMRRSMHHDIEGLRARVNALERESNTAARDLWRQNMLLAARDAERRGEFLRAVTPLEQLLAADPDHADAAAALVRVRREVDSAARALYFGPDGRKNMDVIPAGEVRLRTGERFRPGPFFIDHGPVSERQYAMFEAATGYRSRGKWREQPAVEDSSSDAVHGLTAEDKVAFAQWAGKRPASPQEIEYVTASGFETLAARQQHADLANLYHVAITADGFFCVRDLKGLSDSERDAVDSQARDRAREVRTTIEGLR